MNLKTFALAGAAGVVIAGAASAALVDVVLQPRDGGNAWGVYAIFDSPADAVLGVNSVAGGGEITFSSNIALVNPSPSDTFIGVPGDSWISVGPNPGGTSVSPGWPNGGSFGGTVSGTSWAIPAGESYFQIGPGYSAGNDDDGVVGGVLLANFQYNADASAALLTYTGTLEYVDGVTGPAQFGFTATNVPAPGALALLGVAGLAGTRRRRG